MKTNNTVSKPARLLPHGEIKPLFANIWFVKGQIKMPMAIPMYISRSMTIVKNTKNNELTLINAMRLSDQALVELEKLGSIANVIKIAGFHGKDDSFYREKYQAKIFAIEGQTYSRSMTVPSDVNSGYLQPDVWLTTSSELPIENCELKILKSSRPPEALILIKQEGGILIAGDALQNTATADEYINTVARFVMKKMGFFKAYNVGPGWLRFAKPTKSDVKSILDLEFEHVLPGHGDEVLTGARNKYRPAIEREMKKCRDG